MNLNHLSSSRPAPSISPAKSLPDQTPAVSPEAASDAAPAAILEISPAARHAYDPLPKLPAKQPQPANIIWGSHPAH